MTMLDLLALNVTCMHLVLVNAALYLKFKLLLVRERSAKQCSSVCCVYMVLTDSLSGSYDVVDDVIT